MDSLSHTSAGPSWSMLPSDLLYMVFERLGFADFQRAKCVCSSWQFASRRSAPNNQTPWLILFPKNGKDNCLLFNPEEKDKIYRIQDLGVNFANSHCLAISGSWLFIRDPRYNFYIMNLFTCERIDLPSVESQLGIIKIERATGDMFVVRITGPDLQFHEKYINIKFPLFWIDEKTKDYVVMWTTVYRDTVLVYSRKGDKFWKTFDDFYNVDDMVYKYHKLYLYEDIGDVIVWDFSGDIPQKIFETQVFYDYFVAMRNALRPPGFDIKHRHLVVTVTGEFLRVKTIVRSDTGVWSFRIHKMDSSQSEWKKLTSLGDEAILLDQHTTVLANTIQGINRNSIYFSGVHHRSMYRYRAWSEKDIFNFSLDTHKIERPHPSIWSSIQSYDARWFVPNFKWN